MKAAKGGVRQRSYMGGGDNEPSVRATETAAASRPRSRLWLLVAATCVVLLSATAFVLSLTQLAEPKSHTLVATVDGSGVRYWTPQVLNTYDHDKTGRNVVRRSCWC